MCELKAGRTVRSFSWPRHDNDASNDRRCRSLNGAYIKYGCLRMQIDDSDLCALRAVGINLPTRMAIIWHRGIAKVNRLLHNTHPPTRTTHESSCRVPFEIVEMIIAHLTDDHRALKACSLTCRSWYSVAVPHIHHTLTLRRNTPYPIGRMDPQSASDKLGPLSKLDELGLIPLVKEIRVVQWDGEYPWFTPLAFGLLDLRYFSAFANVHTLKLQRVDIYHFIPHAGHYFGHFSPTLRSITLHRSHCTPRQLSHFLSLFPNLDDIEIWSHFIHVPDTTIPTITDTTTPDTKHISSSALKHRGWLVLHDFPWAEAWTHLIASWGGLRFRHMALTLSGDSAPILFEACAETLESLRFDAVSRLGGKWFCMVLPMESS